MLYLNILVFYVVGNKSDLYTNAVVSDEEGRSFALEINGLFRIISCKTGEGIKEMFDEIGRIIKSEKNQKEQSRISLDKTVKTNAGCCGSKRETKSTCRRTKKRSAKWNWPGGKNPGKAKEPGIPGKRDGYGTHPLSYLFML